MTSTVGRRSAPAPVPVRGPVGVPRALVPWLDAPGLIALALIVGQGLWRGWLVGRGFFTQDDFLMFARSNTALSADLLTQDYSGHLFPGGFLLSWFAAHHAPLDWGVATAEIVALQAVAAGLAWLVLCRLLPDRWARLPILAVYLFCPLALVSTQWWAVAIQFLPVALFLLLAVWAFLARVQDGSRWGAPVVVLATVLGLMFQERAVLYPVVLGFLAVGMASSRTRRRPLGGAVRAHLGLWAALVLVVGAYLFWHRDAAPIDSTSAGSSGDNVALVGNFFFRNLFPGLAGGPWHPDVLGNSLVYPPDWAVVVGTAAVVLLAVWTMVRGGSTAVIGWLLLVVYAFLDAALLFGGRATMGSSFGMLPRYTADILPVMVVVLGLAMRDIAPREGRSGRNGALLAVAAYVASCVPTTLVVAPESYNEFSRTYVTNLRDGLRAEPTAVLFDGLVPREVMTTWFEELGRVSVVLDTAPERPVFDLPSHALRVVATDGTLHPANLVGTTAMEKADDPECGYHVAPGRDVRVPLREPVDDTDLVVRLSYYTSVDQGTVEAEVAGEPYRFDLQRAAQQRRPRGERRIRRHHPAPGRRRRDRLRARPVGRLRGAPAGVVTAPRPRWIWAVPPALAVLVLAPLLTSRGFGLVGDMVFVPEQPWKDAWTGSDGGVPRAVPSDAWVSLATQVVPGDLLQKIVLLLVLAGSGWGVLRLLRDLPPPAALAGAVLFQWNPYVHERLGIGHWALLCGYAALPWCALGARRVRDHGWRALASVALPAAVAAWSSPSGGLIATVVVAGVLVAGLAARRTSVATGLAAGVVLVAVNLAWLLPGLLNGAEQSPDAAGAAAFAARADTPFGLGGSLLTLGGLWKASIDPPERSSVLLAGLALLVTGAALAGLLRGWRRADADRLLLLGLAIPAVLSLAVAWWLSSSVGRPVMEWLITDVPGGGLARDAQKWVAPFALLLAVGFGEAIGWLTARLASRPRGVAPAAAYAAALVPVLLLPSLAWGLLGHLRPSTYPDEWTAVAARLDEAGAADSRLVALPFTVYRRFDWAHDRAVLDPAPRFFPGQVLVDDLLPLGDGRAVGGEAAAAAAVRAAIADGTLERTLRDLGVRWVLVEHGTPGEPGWPTRAGEVVHDGPELTLVDLGEGRSPTVSRWRPLYLAADGLVAIALVVAAAAMALTGLRRVYADRHRKSMA